LGASGGRPDNGRFPTVIEGAVKDGRLVVTVHDVFKRRVVETFTV
jgi:hypothetical protein